MDMWVIGIFVLFVHDASDVFLALGRSYNDYKYKNEILLHIFYFLGFVAWLGFRVLIFSYCCVYAVWYQFIMELHTLNDVEK